MKWIDVLKHAEKIKNHYVIIEPETKDAYGLAVNPEIKLVYISKAFNGDITIDDTSYNIRHSMNINIKYWNKFKQVVDELIIKTI